MANFVILTLTTSLLIGLPFGQLFRELRIKGHITLLTLIFITLGIFVNFIEYGLAISWCISMAYTAPPYTVSCVGEILPRILIFSVVGFILAGVLAYLVYRH